MWLQLDSSNSAFLLEFFPSRLEHLIMRRFLYAIGDKLATDCFFIFFNTGTRNSPPMVVWCYFPFFFHFYRRFALFWRRRDQFTQKFTSRLIPIGIGKLVRIAFINQGNFSRTLFHLFRRRRTQSHAVNADFAAWWLWRLVHNE
jgi:hypothetical protein